MSAAPSQCFGNVTMTIGSWSEAKKLDNGRYIKSDPICAGAHCWRIVFYPNGRLVGTTASMSISLLLDDDANTATAATADEDIYVKFRFMMHEAWNSSAVVVTSSIGAAAFSRRRNAHGFDRFVSHDDFEKTALFESDRFTIQCQLTVVDTPDQSVMQVPPLHASAKPSVELLPGSSPRPPTPPPPSPPVVTPLPSASPAPSVAMSSAAPPSARPEQPLSVPAGQRVVTAKAPLPLSGLNADLGRLLARKDGADVVFVVQGKVIAAHKLVLAARSPVFRDDFFGDAKAEDTSSVRVITDLRPVAFEALLQYLYTDTLPPQMAMTNSPEQGAVMIAEDLERVFLACSR